MTKKGAANPTYQNLAEGWRSKAAPVMAAEPEPVQEPEPAPVEDKASPKTRRDYLRRMAGWPELRKREKRT